MASMRKMSQKRVESYKDQFLDLARLDESVIQRIWIERGEEELESFDDLVYRFDAPLYQKMIFRYWNCKKRPETLVKQIDPVNRNLVFMRYNIPNEEGGDLVEFFSWITNMLSIIDIYQLEKHPEEVKDLENIDRSDLVKRWDNSNGIDFYFGLSSEKQNWIVDKYNDMLRRFS